MGRAHVRQTDELYPSGMSFWGFQFWTVGFSDSSQQQREAECEQFRLKHCPHRISRFESFFACESAELLDIYFDFLLDTNKTANPGLEDDYVIFEVRSEEAAFKGDMKLINSRDYDRYWRGESRQDTIWEVLLRLPVLIEHDVITDSDR